MSTPADGSTESGPSRTDALALSGLMCGLAAALLTVMAFPIAAMFTGATGSAIPMALNLPLPTVGLVLSVVGLVRIRRRGSGGTNLAVTGIVINSLVIAAFLGVVLWVLSGQPG